MGEGPRSQLLRNFHGAHISVCLRVHKQFKKQYTASGVELLNIKVTSSALPSHKEHTERDTHPFNACRKIKN